jgi:hypothetical protein
MEFVDCDDYFKYDGILTLASFNINPLPLPFIVLPLCINWDVLPRLGGAPFALECHYYMTDECCVLYCRLPEKKIRP